MAHLFRVFSLLQDEQTHKLEKFAFEKNPVDVHKTRNPESCPNPKDFLWSERVKKKRMSTVVWPDNELLRDKLQITESQKEERKRRKKGRRNSFEQSATRPQKRRLAYPPRHLDRVM